MAPRTHVRTATTIGRRAEAQLPRPFDRFGHPAVQATCHDDLDTAVMLGFRRFRQGYKAQSVPPAILTPGPR